MTSFLPLNIHLFGICIHDFDFEIEMAKTPPKPLLKSRNELIAQKEKNKMFHKYKKMLRKETKGITTGHTFSKNKNATTAPPTSSTSGAYRTANKRAQEMYDEKLKEKEKEKQELEQKQAQKTEAILKYKETKKSKFKTLCAKSKTGQIKMGKQMDLLLNKIQINLKK